MAFCCHDRKLDKSSETKAIKSDLSKEFAANVNDTYEWTRKRLWRVCDMCVQRVHVYVEGVAGCLAPIGKWRL